MNTTVVQRLLEQRLHLVGLHLGVNQTQTGQEGLLRGGQAHQGAHGLVVGAVGAPAQQHRHLGVGVGEVVVDVAQLVVGGFVPLGVGLHAHQAAHVLVEVHVPGRGVVVLLVVGALGQRVEAGLARRTRPAAPGSPGSGRSARPAAPATRRPFLASTGSRSRPFTSTMALQSWPQRLGSQEAGR